MQATITDEELIERIIHGQDEATAMLIQRYQDFCFNLAFRVVNNRQDAEEAVQDSFVKAIMAIRAFKKQSSFKTWLYRIVYNTSLNRLRKGSGSSVSIDDVPEEQIVPDEGNEETRYDKTLVRQQINQALKRLSPENRTITSLYYFEQFTVEEIAEVTLLSVNLVKVRLHRSRDQLKSLLQNVERGYQR